MKHEEFEHALKQLSGDFNLPVTNKMFDNMMEKRTRERRKKKFLAWASGCSIAALLVLGSVLYLYPGDAENGTLNQVATVTEKPGFSAPQQENAAQPAGKETPVEGLKETATAATQPIQTNSTEAPSTQVNPEEVTPVKKSGTGAQVTNKKTAEPAATTTAVKPVKEVTVVEGSKPQVKNKLKQPGKAALAPERTIGNQTAARKKGPVPVAAIVMSTTGITGQVAKETPADATGKRPETKSSSDTKPALAKETLATAEKEPIKDEPKETKQPTVTKPATALTPLPDVPKTETAINNTGAGNPADSSAPAAQQATTPARGHKWMVGIYGDYTPVTSAKNCNAAIPLPQTDSLGLTDKANYAFSVGFKFGYAINERWRIDFGLGYHKVEFDKVRLVYDIKVDSARMESLTGNSPYTKSTRESYAFNISDRSLSWMQVPLSVTFDAAARKRVSFYAQAGIVYQLLVQSQGYEFTTWKDSLKYNEVENKGLNRINRHQFALFAEPGIKIQVTSRIQYRAGIVYRRHITSLYKQAYQSNTPAYYLGLSSAINFIF